MSKWLWQSATWPDLRYDAHALAPSLAAARRAQGEIIGLAQALGMTGTRNARAQIWVAESLATANIEGERLDEASVRSSVARRLGLADDARPSTPAIDGLLDMMEDAASRRDKPLTKARLCAWQAALFPTGFSGLHKVQTGKLRSSAEPMQIVSGPVHKPKVHFEAPPAKHIPAELARFLDWLRRQPQPRWPPARRHCAPVVRDHPSFRRRQRPRRARHRRSIPGAGSPGRPAPVQSLSRTGGAARVLLRRAALGQPRRCGYRPLAGMVLPHVRASLPSIRRSDRDCASQSAVLGRTCRKSREQGAGQVPQQLA